MRKEAEKLRGDKRAYLEKYKQICEEKEGFLSRLN